MRRDRCASLTEDSHINVANEPRAVALERRVGSICVFGSELLGVQDA